MEYLLRVRGFAEHTIATGLKGGYQVVVADMNHDGKLTPNEYGRPHHKSS